MFWLLMIVLLVLLVSITPAWGYSRNWGYGPSGLVGIVLVVLLVMVLTDTIRI